MHSAFRHDPDSDEMFLDRETHALVERLMPVFLGTYELTDETRRDHDYLLAVVLGWYFSWVVVPGQFADPKPFIAEAGWRLRDMDEGELPSGSERAAMRRLIGNSTVPPKYPGGLIGMRGLTPGCLGRLRARAAKVFVTVMDLHEMPDREARQGHVSTLTDQVLLDCAAWGMVSMHPDPNRRSPDDVIEYIRSVESSPRL